MNKIKLFSLLFISALTLPIQASSSQTNNSIQVITQQCRPNWTAMVTLCDISKRVEPAAFSRSGHLFRQGGEVTSFTYTINTQLPSTHEKEEDLARIALAKARSEGLSKPNTVSIWAIIKGSTAVLLHAHEQKLPK